MTTHSEAAAPRGADLKAGALAGLIAAIVFMMMEMGLVAMTGGSPWGPPRMIAAIVMGEGVLPPPATFDLAVLMAAMVVHLVLSVLIGVAFAFVAARLGFLMTVLAGALLGLALYVINFYGFTEIFPWFAMARNWISIVSHIAFGVILGWSYRGLSR